MAIDQKELAYIREAKALFRKQLAKIPGAHMLSIAYKKTAGKKTKQLALVVHVFKKLPKKLIPAEHLIPETFSFTPQLSGETFTITTDVCEADRPVMLACDDCDANLQSMERPLPGGYSISISGSLDSGTIGGWVWDTRTDQVVFISNAHVLGEISEDGLSATVTAGTRVTQPSFEDGPGLQGSLFGEVIRQGSMFDAAIGSPYNIDNARLEIECIGSAVYATIDPEIGMEVEKVGRTTGRTCGVIENIDVEGLGPEGNNHFGSAIDFIIAPDDPDVFSNRGDSGSIIVKREETIIQDGQEIQDVRQPAVGLLWGSNFVTGAGLAHPIKRVFSTLNVKPICDGYFDYLLGQIVFSGYSSFLAKQMSEKQGKQFSRELEKRFLETKTGTKISEMLRRYRVDAIQVLMHGDGLRAVVVALEPILKGKVTTQEVLDYKLGKKDIENFKRVLNVVKQLRPKTKIFLTFANILLKNAEGKTIAQLLGKPKSRKSK